MGIFRLRAYNAYSENDKCFQFMKKGHLEWQNDSDDNNINDDDDDDDNDNNENNNDDDDDNDDD